MYYKIIKDNKIISCKTDKELIFVKYNKINKGVRCDKNNATHISIDDTIYDLQDVIIELVSLTEYNECKFALTSTGDKEDDLLDVESIAELKPHIDADIAIATHVMNEFVIPTMKLYEYGFMKLGSGIYKVVNNQGKQLVIEFSAEPQITKYEYKLNNRGPFRHNSYEFIISDIEHEFNFTK